MRGTNQGRQLAKDESPRQKDEISGNALQKKGREEIDVLLREAAFLSNYELRNLSSE